MKKTLIFLLTFILILAVPVSVLAASQNYNIEILKNIAKDYDITIDTSNYYVCFESGGSVVLQTYSRDIYKPCLDSTGAYMLTNGSAYVQFNEYKFNASNIYLEPSYRSVNNNAVVKYGSPVFKYSNVDIYASQTSSDVVFQPAQSPQNPNQALGTVFTTPTLSGVLTELIAILPILLPILIIFLSIRKGLSFTLQTLRSS